MIRTLCVFAGSSLGHHPEYAGAARALGRAIGRHGYNLVFGGTTTGLMALVANAAEGAGAEIIGVVPGLEWDSITHAHLKALVRTNDLPERKWQMMALADAFVVLPGGLGTLDELATVLIEIHLGHLNKPVGILDVRGFFRPLVAFLGHAADEGFIGGSSSIDLCIETQPDRLLLLLAHHRAESVGSEVGNHA